jgi:hypothetical protein
VSLDNNTNGYYSKKATPVNIQVSPAYHSFYPESVTKVLSVYRCFLSSLYAKNTVSRRISGGSLRRLLRENFYPCIRNLALRRLFVVPIAISVITRRHRLAFVVFRTALARSHLVSAGLPLSRTHLVTVLSMAPRFHLILAGLALARSCLVSFLHLLFLLRRLLAVRSRLPWLRCCCKRTACHERYHQHCRCKSLCYFHEKLLLICGALKKRLLLFSSTKTLAAKCGSFVKFYKNIIK